MLYKNRKALVMLDFIGVQVSSLAPWENPVKSAQSVEITGFLLFRFEIIRHVLKRFML